MAPEALSKGLNTHSSDVWSFGVLAWEAFSLGALPYGDISGARDVLTAIEAGHRLPSPPGCPTRIYELMHSCWSLDPCSRANFREICGVIHQVQAAPNSAAVTASAGVVIGCGDQQAPLISDDYEMPDERSLRGGEDQPLLSSSEHSLEQTSAARETDSVPWYAATSPGASRLTLTIDTSSTSVDMDSVEGAPHVYTMMDYSKITSVQMTDAGADVDGEGREKKRIDKNGHGGRGSRRGSWNPVYEAVVHSNASEAASATADYETVDEMDRLRAEAFAAGVKFAEQRLLLQQQQQKDNSAGVSTSISTKAMKKKETQVSAAEQGNKGVASQAKKGLAAQTKKGVKTKDEVRRTGVVLKSKTGPAADTRPRSSPNPKGSAMGTTKSLSATQSPSIAVKSRIDSGVVPRSRTVTSGLHSKLKKMTAATHGAQDSNFGKTAPKTRVHPFLDRPRIPLKTAKAYSGATKPKVSLRKTTPIESRSTGAVVSEKLSRDKAITARPKVDTRSKQRVTAGAAARSSASES